MDTLNQLAAPIDGVDDEPEDVFALVLELVLQHAQQGSWDIQALFSLMQASKTSRATVLSSRVACPLSPSDFARRGHNAGSLQHIMGFAAWLPGHARLVSSLELYAPDSPSDAAAADQLLALALRLCAQQSATATAAAGSATTAAAESRTAAGLRQPLQQLWLQSYTGNLLLQPAALGALAGSGHLTRLSWQQLSAPLPPAVLNSLSCLTSLRELGVDRATNDMRGPGSHPLPSLAQLTRLQTLSYKHLLPLVTLQHLPASLLTLNILIDLPWSPQPPPTVILSHLTALKTLAVAVAGLSEQSVLPASLTWLQLISCGAIQMQRPSLPHLEDLIVMQDPLQPSLMQHMGAMPALRRLELQLAANSALAPGTLSAAQAHVAASMVALATQVTQLSLHRVFRGGVDGQQDAPVVLHGALLVCQRAAAAVLPEVGRAWCLQPCLVAGLCLLHNPAAAVPVCKLGLCAV